MYALYRIARIRHKRKTYVLMLTLACLVLLALGPVLAGPLDGFGVALAGVIGSLLGTIGMVVAIQRSEHPIPFQWRRIASAFVVGALGVVAVTASPVDGALRVLQDAAILAGFPVLMVATGAVPRSALGAVRATARAAVPRRPGARALVERAEQLPRSQRARARALAGRHEAGVTRLANARARGAR